MSPYIETLDGTALYPLGLGTTGTGTDRNATPNRDQYFVDLFQRAIDLGINCFDTAEIYGGGYAETLLGRAIGPMRESLFIVTKFNPENATPKRLRKALDGSLARLDCDYVDQYQMHWPNPFVPFEETWREMERLLGDGKIRSVGIGNCSMEELESYWRISNGGITAIEICFNVAEPDAEDNLISWCRERGVMVFAYSPLGQGKLIGASEAGFSRTAMENLRVHHNCTIQGLLLAWVASICGCIPLVRTSSLLHLQENCSSVRLTLTPEERMLLVAAFRRKPSVVPIDSIMVVPIDSRGCYLTEIEALENRFDWVPSPAILAERIRLGSIQAPLRLRRNGTGSLLLDTYDFQGEMKKYWALRLVYGDTAEVTAFVNEESV